MAAVLMAVNVGWVERRIAKIDYATVAEPGKNAAHAVVVGTILAADLLAEIEHASALLGKHSAVGLLLIREHHGFVVAEN